MLKSRGLLPPGEHPDNPWGAIRNGSDQPMYDCVLRVLHPDWRTNRRQPIASPGFSCVYPNELSEPFELRGVDVPPFAEGQNGAVPVQVEFRDGHGRRWCRRPDGRLRRGR